MRNVIVLAVALLCGVASGQNMLVNGDFQTGDWSGWSVKPTTNGQTGIQTVQLYDIDGAGPLGESLAGRLSVGKVTYSGPTAGMYMTQSLNLTAGVQYKIDADISSFFDTTNPPYYSNADGGQFSLVAGSSVLASWQAGEILAGEKMYFHLTGNYTPASSGPYDVGLLIVRDYVPSAYLSQFVDNVVCVPEPATLVLVLGLLALRRR